MEIGAHFFKQGSNYQQLAMFAHETIMPCLILDVSFSITLSAEATPTYSAIMETQSISIQFQIFHCEFDYHCSKETCKSLEDFRNT